MPTLNFLSKEGLRFILSFDDKTPQIINLPIDLSGKTWERALSENITVAVSKRRFD